MNVKDTTKKGNLEKQLRTLNERQKVADCFITFRLNSMQLEKLKANNSVTIGFMGLKMLMGMPVKDSLVLTDIINENNLSADVLYEDNFEYGIRKDFQYLTTIKKLSAFNVKRYQLSFLPTITMNGAYTKNAQRTKFDFFEKNGNWFETALIGLNINLPLFNGGSTTAKIKNAKIVPELNGNPSVLTVKISVLPKKAKVYGKRSLKINSNIAIIITFAIKNDFIVMFLYFLKKYKNQSKPTAMLRCI